MSGDDVIGDLTEEIADAVTTRLLQRVAEIGHYAGVMAELSDVERAEVEAAVERHAARRRARGEPGW